MVLKFENWTLSGKDRNLAQQYDHLSRTLTVEGDLPQGWNWVMLVDHDNGKEMDILPLHEVEDGIGLTLTAQQLAVAGSYRLQLKGEMGAQIRRTNTLSVYVGSSLSGDVQWPEIPSHFSVLEKEISKNADSVKEYALHPPVLGENGNWQLWNGTSYEDAGYSPIDSLMAALPAAEEESV